MWNRRTRQVLARLLLTVVLVGAVVPGTASAETELGVSVVVERGETVGDVTAAAGSVLILGTVEGDVTALAGNVVVTGEVTGDVTAVGGNVEVAGDVGGAVRAFAVNLAVDGRVGEDVEAIVGFLVVGGRVRGPVEATGAFVEVERDGRILGGLEATAYQTVVNSSIGGVSGESGESRTEDETATPEPSSDRDSPSAPARTGQQTTFAAAAANRMVSNGDDAVRPQLVPGVGRGGGFGVFDVYGFLVNLLFGAILVGLLPNFSARIASVITHDPVRIGLFGVATLVVVPLVLLVLALSLFGLPISLAGGVLYLVGSWVGSAYGRFAVGTWLSSVTTRTLTFVDIESERGQSRWVRLVVGFLVVGLLIRVPYVGSVVDAVVLALGLGGLVSLGFDAYVRSERGSPSPDAETAGQAPD